MYYNRENEMKRNRMVKEAWLISKKYSQILMNNEINDKFLNMYRVTYGQFINELRNKKIHFTNDKNYIQCWNTVLNTIIRNPKIMCQRRAIKLLHQTNIQNSYVYDRQIL